MLQDTGLAILATLVGAVLLLLDLA